MKCSNIREDCVLGNADYLNRRGSIITVLFQSFREFMGSPFRQTLFVVVCALFLGPISVGTLKVEAGERVNSIDALVQQDVNQRRNARLALRKSFNSAYQAYPQLPAGILEAIAFVNTRWIHQIPEDVQSDHHDMPQGFGVMGLYHGGGFRDVVAEASKVSGLSVDSIIQSPEANIKATAALLDFYRQQRGLNQPTLEQMAPLLEQLSGLPGSNAVAQFTRASFAYDVLLTLERGHDDFEIRVKAQRIQWNRAFDGKMLNILRAPFVRIEGDRIESYGKPFTTATVTTNAAVTTTTDYPGALWVPSPNYSSRSGKAITHVAIHTTQGSYSGAISWLQNPASSVSAHYVIRSSDGQITQMVREYDKAWHIGSENSYTIGIEHEGFVDTSSYYTTAMYNASAALTKDICTSNAIDCSTTFPGPSSSGVSVQSSSYKVKGHQHFPNQSHTDPGLYWDWARYKSLVSGGTPPAPTVTILDSFEGSEGHFATSPTYSGSTVGISTSSTADRSTSAKKNGSYGESIVLYDNTSSTSNWQVRFLSGSGSTSQNTALTKSGGFVGLWVFTPSSGVTVALGVDDSDGTEISTSKSVPTNTWTYLEWSLGDANQWSPWYLGNGALDASTVTLDAVWFFRSQTSSAVTIYIDDVQYKR